MARRRKAHKGSKKGSSKKLPKWAKWTLGLGAAAAVAYVLWPKTASAATLPPAGGGGGGGAPKPAPSPPAPVKGEIILSPGSTVRLTAPLDAHVAESPLVRLTVPADTTLTIEDVSANGDILFKYSGMVLTSPVEDYTDKIV